MLFDPIESSCLGIAAVIGGARVCLAAVCWHGERFQAKPELSRKLLHVMLGTGFLSFPWLFREAWPVVAVCAAFVGLLSIRNAVPTWRRGVAGAMHGVTRRSHGEYWFPVATAILFVLAKRRPLYFCGPLALLTYADAAAAIVGTRYGKRKFKIAGGVKSVEGSAACFIVAAFCIAVTLLLNIVPPAMTGTVSIAIATVATFTELIAPSGLDNLVLPLIGWGMLKLMI